MPSGVNDSLRKEWRNLRARPSTDPQSMYGAGGIFRLSILLDYLVYTMNRIIMNWPSLIKILCLCKIKIYKLLKLV